MTRHASPAARAARRGRRAAARAVVLAAVGLAVTAGPAAADAPTPGDYTSEVTSLTPPRASVALDVVGGDSFLQLTVAPGTDVVVMGYEGEPFVHVREDGIVERNRNSPATYLNEDRYAAVDIPATLVGVDPTTLEPDWEAVASGGRYAWHDHRIHWMAPNAPPAVSRGGSFDWTGTVSLLVDGTPVEANGVIEYHHDSSPLPWIGLGAVAAVVIARSGRRWPRAIAPFAVVVSAAATGVGWATWDAAPSGVGLSPLPLVVAALGVVAGIAAISLPTRLRPIALAFAASVLLSWGLLRVSVLTSPVLPTTAPFVVDRSTTVVAIVAGLAIAALVLPALARPEPQADQR